MKLVLPFVLVLVACANEDPIARVVADVADAAEDRDAGEVMEHLSPSYEGRAEVETTLRRYFFAYNTMDINVRNLQSTISAGQAFVTFQADFLGHPEDDGRHGPVPPTLHHLQVRARDDGRSRGVEDQVRELGDAVSVYTNNLGALRSNACRSRRYTSRLRSSAISLDG